MHLNFGDSIDVYKGILNLVAICKFSKFKFVFILFLNAAETLIV